MKKIFRLNRIFLLIFLISISTVVGIINAENSIDPYLGNYKVTFVGKVGGPYEPSGSIVTGTTTGIIPFSLEGNITLSESEPGVIAVPEGTAIPGINPEDILFGAAVMQNPIHVFIGTEEATRPGDFGLFSMVKFGIPEGDINLEIDKCEGRSPFSCLPVFFKTYPSSGRSVNLIYFVIQAWGNPDSVVITGILYDRHITEAAAANLFSVPIESPILGSLNDSFILNLLTQYKIVIRNNKINGWIKGSGYSVAGLAPQEAILEVEFEGTKESNTGTIQKTDDISVSVFPNPSQGRFIITGNSEFTDSSAEIYSLLSGKLYSFNIKSFPFELDMGSHKPGIYLLRIFNSDLSVLKKIALQ